MKRAKIGLPIFFFLLVLSIILLLFIQNPLMQPLQSVTLPIQKWIFTTFSQVPLISSGDTEKIQEENNALRRQLAQFKRYEMDNKALRDQFETTTPAPRDLLPANVVGMNEDTIIIDKGGQDRVKVGDIIVLKDNLVGKVSKTSPNVSRVTLISHPATSFTAETAKTAAIGVVKARGGDTITLENVVLSDKVEKDDLVVTRGNIDERGEGFPSELVVGKVISVNKKASNLFQEAQIKSLVDFKRVRMVFVIIN
ncbi:MAG: rod shape-determining protein MreC [Candidatus Levybacteria bacterium]|nr:rod shape-determining protein MreC [Candidatus Levybacteria bacterium]